MIEPWQIFLLQIPVSIAVAWAYDLIAAWLKKPKPRFPKETILTRRYIGKTEVEIGTLTDLSIAPFNSMDGLYEIENMAWKRIAVGDGDELGWEITVTYTTRQPQKLINSAGEELGEIL